MKSFALCCILFAASAYGKSVHPVEARALSHDFIQEINSKQSSWVAGKNFPENTTFAYLKGLNGVLGVSADPNHKSTYLKHENINVQDMPESFDARATWTKCENIGQIRNQGACGSCWAFGAVESMTDRLCIHSDGGIKFKFSPEDLVSCCSNCGFGCQGGYLLQAFQYWDDNGIVSGGDINSNEGCRPYSDGAMNHGETPACTKSCRNGYGSSYDNDKHFGIAAYEISPSVEQMQYEIMVNGPIEVMYEVFEDFYSYNSGVYHHVSGNSVGYHAVKAIGWGVENGNPYWLIANSWGTSFGENGFFKIARGRNECGIEEHPTAGIPKLN